ncbi:MAG TPA: prepilin-type N-terminal cleavage/methylation domain-containing protein [Candidatus Hydrogenedentes bacterium]|nr:prepilin-type N-terminal cleavage/methylation domain-containing protein [Candidatus Hydrogenedentota bacterium]
MKNTGGFTLIELILVTVIIGILAGMVMVNYGGRAREAQIRAAKGDIANLSTAVDLFALDNNDNYPSSLDDLVSGKRRYVRELQPDPWGNPYNYKPPTDILRADYDIFSSGPDGVPGTEDDVTLTSPMP